MSLLRLPIRPRSSIHLEIQANTNVVIRARPSGSGFGLVGNFYERIFKFGCYFYANIGPQFILYSNVAD